MAKKTESTAVNDLINLVATQGPSVKDPGADLFSEPPKKSARMTATVPGAGAVEPLPRTRAPAGTQQNASVTPPVRVSAAMPRANSIPPLADGRSRPALPPPRSSASMPRPPIPSSAKIAVPAEPELDIDMDEDDEADLLKTPVAAQPRKVTPLNVAAVTPVAPTTLPPVAPMTLPTTAEPTYPRAERTDHPNAASDMTGAAPWFEDSRAVERLSVPEASHSMTENTAQVQRKNGTVDLLKKLALPMGIAIVLGIFVGGYIVFDGQGGKKRTAASVDPASAVDPANAVAPASAVDPATAVAPASAVDPANAVAPANTDTVANADDTSNSKPADVVASDLAKADDTAAKSDDTAAKSELVAAKSDDTAAKSADNEPTKVAAAAPSVLGGAVDSLPTTATAPKVAKPAFVDVRIDSTPSGADVSLVDRGKTTFLGTTPISASVDPSRSYDVVFSYANKPTQVEHFDPKSTTRLSIKLGKSGNQAQETAKPAKVEAPKAIAKVSTPKPEKTEKAEKAEKAEKKTVTEVKAKPAAKAKVAEPFEDDTAALERKLAEKKSAKSEVKDTEAAVAKSVVKGEGTLMISSKPPCEIWIDGTSTGLMTPQRAMTLPAGKHKITLVSPDKAHKKTIAVEITPDKPTKVIQDLLK